MSLGRCLPDLMASGAISRETGQWLGELFDDLARDYRRQFGAQAAEAMASEATREALAREVSRRKRQRLLAVQAQARMGMDMARYDGGVPGVAGAGGGPINPRAAEALFDADGRAGYSSAEGLRKAILAQAHAMTGGILARHHRDMIGNVRDRAGLAAIGHEAFGRDTGDVAARELNEAWQRAAEWLRQRFNAAGGHIAKADRWGLPQAHDSRLVRAAGYHAWRDFTLPLLDRERMIDGRTGRPFSDQALEGAMRVIDGRTGRPFSDQALEGAMRDVWETIRTDGMNKREVGGARGRALANGRAEHRFLQFADFDAWSAYADRFGTGDAYSAIVGHMHAMARDIALMERFGPNPAAALRWLQDMLAKTAALDMAPDSKAIDRAHAGGRRIQRLYDEISGANGAPESRQVALVFSTLRSLQTAAKLGSATISAMATDPIHQAMTRKINGLPAAGMIADYAKLIAGDHEFAVRAGLIAEEWASLHSAQSRYLNEELTGEVARRLAEGVLRVSGLSRFTQAGRWAFGMEFLNTITRERGKGWDALDRNFRRAFVRYGMDAADWDALRATRMEDHKGSGWILPANIADQHLADRVLGMILTETDKAVPAADLRTRAMMNAYAPRGTIIGEVIRSAFLFKSFGISMMFIQSRRMMEMQSGWDRLGYAAGFTIALTLGGALAMQLKAIAKGQDPLPMDPASNPGFWGAAMLQGGGFGIFGDFIGATENRFGGGFASTLAGPMVQSANNLAYQGGDLIAAANPFATDRERAAKWHASKRDFTRLLRQEVPGSSLWMTRLLYERAMIDQIDAAIDPDWRRHQREMERRAADRGTGYWAPPADIDGTRAPDLMNAFRPMEQDQ